MRLSFTIAGFAVRCASPQRKEEKKEEKMKKVTEKIHKKKGKKELKKKGKRTHIHAIGAKERKNIKGE